MKNIFFGIFIAVLLFFGWNYFEKNIEPEIVVNQTGLIKDQIKNVGKLVVLEGHFSDVLNYKNSKSLFADMLFAKKKALVVVNADVTIAYDLSKLEYIIDEENKILQITHIPEEEIKIHPELEYYDVQSDYLNPFEAKDYNTISGIVKKSLMQKINASNFKNNAKNRLLSELSKIYVITNSMGWQLKYNQELITDTSQLQNIKG